MLTLFLLLCAWCSCDLHCAVDRLALVPAAMMQGPFVMPGGMPVSSGALREHLQGLSSMQCAAVGAAGL